MFRRERTLLLMASPYQPLSLTPLTRSITRPSVVSFSASWPGRIDAQRRDARIVVDADAAAHCFSVAQEIRLELHLWRHLGNGFGTLSGNPKTLHIAGVRFPSPRLNASLQNSSSRNHERIWLRQCCPLTADNIEDVPIDGDLSGSQQAIHRVVDEIENFSLRSSLVEAA